VPPGLPGYQQATPDYAHWTREARFAEARRLYAEAGYSAERPLKVEIRYNTQEDNRKIAVAVAQMWKQVLGVEATLFNEEWKVFLQNRKQKQVTQVFRSGWIGDYADPYTFLELLHSQHGINDSGYANPAYDALLARISALPGGSERNDLMRQAEAMMLADDPVIPLFFYVSKTLIKPWVKGYRPNIMNQHYTKDLWIEPLGG
jgi:oligopeptide transport system substrate-binding protein